jgi:hypothetical protein
MIKNNTSARKIHYVYSVGLTIGNCRVVKCPRIKCPILFILFIWQLKYIRTGCHAFVSLEPIIFMITNILVPNIRASNGHYFFIQLSNKLHSNWMPKGQTTWSNVLTHQMSTWSQMSWCQMTFLFLYHVHRCLLFNFKKSIKKSIFFSFKLHSFSLLFGCRLFDADELVADFAIKIKIIN